MKVGRISGRIIAGLALTICLALGGCSSDEATKIPNAKPLDPDVAKKFAGWRSIPGTPGYASKMHKSGGPGIPVGNSAIPPNSTPSSP